MTNYEELEKAVDTMNKLDEAPWEMQQTIYLGAIAQFLARIADTLKKEPCEDCIKIPEGATNRDMIKAVFGFEPQENTCIIPKELCNGNPAECDGCRFNDFWESPYRKEQE